MENTCEFSLACIWILFEKCINKAWVWQLIWRKSWQWTDCCVRAWEMCTGCRMMPLAWWQLQGRDHTCPCHGDTGHCRDQTLRASYKLRDISILTLSSSRLSRVLGYPEQSPNGLYQYQYLDKLACEEMKWTAQLKSLQKNLHGFLVTQCRVLQSVPSNGERWAPMWSIVPGRKRWSTYNLH